jgi:hypothetical protein
MFGAAVFAGISTDAANTHQSQSTPPAECYTWRQYILRGGMQPRRLADFLQAAAIPALNRLGHQPIGVFEVVFGVPSPSVFVLTPSASFESLLTIEARLDRDEQFVRAAAPYFDAPATDPCTCARRCRC